MKFRFFLLLSIFSILALVLAACGPNTPEANNQEDNSAPSENSSENTVDDVMEDPAPSEMTPMVEVSDQDASGGSVTVDKVVAADPGWIVIHTESDGAPGPIVGYSQVDAGESNAVAVEIDVDAATEMLFAMLHVDAGTPGTYEFPGDDGPVSVDGSVVVVPFSVSLPMSDMTPSVSVSDQETSGKVVIEEVVAAESGWIVIHTESDGAPGPVIGFAQVSEGTNSNVEVEIDLGAATENLFAMLHVDAGTAGTYEFPGDDGPVRVDDAVVMMPFRITAADTGMGSPGDEVTVMVQDSRFQAKEVTVKVGTTITWVMDANFPHTVTADDGSFDSGRLGSGDTFTITFDEVGEFPYYCAFHGGPGGSGMAGTVTVTE